MNGRLKGEREEARGKEDGTGFLCMWGGGCLREGLRAVSPLVSLRRGARPFSQLLVSSLSPLGMTAEAVAALRRPALVRQWRETYPTHSRLWGPSRSLPPAQANRDEFMAGVEAKYLPVTLQCYSTTPPDMLLLGNLRYWLLHNCFLWFARSLSHSAKCLKYYIFIPKMCS